MLLNISSARATFCCLNIIRFRCIAISAANFFHYFFFKQKYSGEKIAVAYSNYEIIRAEEGGVTGREIIVNGSTLRCEDEIYA